MQESELCCQQISGLELSGNLHFLSDVISFKGKQGIDVAWYWSMFLAWVVYQH